MKKAKGVYRTLPAKNPEARATRILQLTVDGAGAELHTSACYHCRRNLLPLLQKSALECPRIPRAWVWASVALEPSSEDYLKDNFSSQPNVSTEILYPFFVVVMSVNWWCRCVVIRDGWFSNPNPQGKQANQKCLLCCFFFLSSSITNLKYWGRCEPITSKTLQLLNDLSIGYPFLSQRLCTTGIVVCAVLEIMAACCFHFNLALWVFKCLPF